MSDRPGAQWSGGSGFVLAAIGAAVGLGNVWRFAFVVGENGGGAFILAYLVCVLVLGLPLMIAELAAGRAAGPDPVGTFRRIAPAAPWRWAGIPGVVAAVAILAYYPVVAGWVGTYLARYVLDGAALPAGADPGTAFGAMIADPVQALLGMAVVMAISAAIVGVGVQRGIETACRILMPLLALLLLGLAVHALTLPGAGRALDFLFRPDWAALARPATWLAATGQAFFSLGLAMGILVAYGGYLGEARGIPAKAAMIVAGDTGVALVAGLVIFPVVFSFGLDPAHGATLVFIVLPEVFAALPAGRLIATIFFLLLLIAAITSIISLIEVPVAIAGARPGRSRTRATLVVAVLATLLAVPAALGFGALEAVRPAGLTLLDALDLLVSNLLLPLSGIAIALCLGWRWRRVEAEASSGLAGGIGLAWLWSLRIVVPLGLAVLLVTGFWRG